MKQGNGSALLGTNDPRSSTIGIITVAPSDDREGVLAAILTQEKLGRKQIVIDLPAQNKAFQRPVDFDGLKNMRRNLKATLIVVAPHGSSPAEFARQRQFQVFPSLDGYKQSLQQESEAPSANRRGWMPFRRQPRLQLVPESPTPPPAEPPPAPQTEEQLVTPPVDADAGQSEPPQKEQPPVASHGKEAALGLGLGLGAGAAAAYAAEHAMHPPDAQTSFANGQAHAQPDAPSVDQNIDHDLASPTASAAAAGADSSLAGNTSSSADAAVPPPSTERTETGEHPDGDIYTFSPTPSTSARNSGQIPVPPVVPVPENEPDKQSNIIPIQKRRSSGKRPVVGAVVGATAGAGAAGAALSAHAATPRTGTSPSGPAGPPPSQRGRRKRRWPLVFLLLALLLLVSVVLCSVTALAAPTAFGGLGTAMARFIPGLPVGTPSATVTIVPKHADEQNIYVIQGVINGHPDPAKRQVEARTLTSPVESQSKTVDATGVQNHPAVAATGTLTFYNGNGIDEVVQASNTIFTVGSVQIKLTQNVDIPPSVSAGVPGQASVSAYADPPGKSGNIGAGAINVVGCCGNSAISVKNLNPFGGGADAFTTTTVQQSDINNAANPLKGPLQSMGLASPNLKKKANEQYLAHQPSCITNVTSDHQAGEQAQTVTVTVSVTCSGVVYDQVGAQTISSNLLKQQASKDLTPDYILVGNLTTQVLQVSTDKQGNIDLRIKAEGIWVFQFTDAEKANLAKLIAGKSRQDAKTLLQQQPGVDSVAKIDITGADGSTLPSDPKQITIVIEPVPGLQSTPTPAPTSGLPTGTPSPPGKF